MFHYWIQLFHPRSRCDIRNFLPPQVKFIQTEELPPDLWEAAKAGRIRLLLECPSKLEGLEFGDNVYADSFKARSVVADSWFGEAIPPNRILIQHNFVLRKVKTPVKAHLVAARIAGYRDACFGLKDAEQQPLLFEHPLYSNVLISTTPLASFIASRFAPACDWKRVIGRLLGFLSGTDEILDIDYQMPVRPTYDAGQPLPEDAGFTAFRRNVEWFYQHMIYNRHGMMGVLEGVSSIIDVTGRQWIMPALRGDCLGECSAVGALDYAITQEPAGREMSEGLLKTMLDTSKVRDVLPISQTYGSLFFDAETCSVYGDDNSRAGLGALLSEDLLGTAKHAEKILEIGYSLLRTTGPNGLRIPSLLQPESFAPLYDGTVFLEAKTWQYYREYNYPECHPHYQAWHWAFNLSLYTLTGDRRFRDSAVAALEEANRCFPDFYWQNGATGDWARVLLPYAMLVEVEDTPEHRQWLEKAAVYFIGKMNEFHVVPEYLGARELGQYPPPDCNAKYGTGESALIQKNGDPACDLLYSLNYAFPGMHEAWMATGDMRYKKACDQMADFFCRVQATSTEQPYLDGAWLHGFDYELWEFFGNASDSGWGPWCVETGWTNAWIAVTLGLRKLNRPLLSVKHADIYRQLAPEIGKKMFTPLVPSVTTRGTRTEISSSSFSSFARG